VAANPDAKMSLLRTTLFLFALLAAHIVVADVIGIYRDWVAVTSSSDNEKTCMIWSQPKQSEGYKGKRGEAFAFVTHQPADKRLDRVSFEKEFNLSASGTGAWTRNSADDTALIEAMRAGSTMTVTGNGPGGETVKDRYSLYGFAAAYNAISAACNVR
jgi:hypothetical protein